MADLNPEKAHLVALMTGLMVIVEYTSGPNLTEENQDKVLDEGEILKGTLETRTASLYLENYSTLGIEVSKEPGSVPTYFIPWSAVIAIYTLQNRQELVDMAKEDMAEQQSDEMQEEENPT